MRKKQQKKLQKILTRAFLERNLNKEAFDSPELRVKAIFVDKNIMIFQHLNSTKPHQIDRLVMPVRVLALKMPRHYDDGRGVLRLYEGTIELEGSFIKLYVDVKRKKPCFNTSFDINMDELMSGGAFKTSLEIVKQIMLELVRGGDETISQTETC